ncbi:uncharacterized protein FFE2_13892 [Fusarium fujikuroi]|nr:uncharacterized protein FFE2_13892 [Fusarium fujikuroi]
MLACAAKPPYTLK